MKKLLASIALLAVLATSPAAAHFTMCKIFNNTTPGPADTILAITSAQIKGQNGVMFNSDFSPDVTPKNVECGWQGKVCMASFPCSTDLRYAQFTVQNRYFGPQTAPNPINTATQHTIAITGVRPPYTFTFGP